MRIRLIIQSDESGETEYVEFTDDFEADVNDFKYPTCKIDLDKIIEMDEVMGFPINSTLQRR